MNSPADKPRRRRLWGILAAVVVAEAALVGGFIWPLAAAKWRASPDRREANQPATRPANWAQQLSITGLKNASKVSPGLYRAARPTAEGLRQLKTMGVRTVVNLEVFHSDEEMLAGTGLNGVRISFKAWHPEPADIVAFLKVAADANLTPVFVHCLHGSDRTGTMCAVYRIAVQGWDKQQAIDEMVHGGFGFHPDWQNLLEFIDKLDVDALKKEAGMER